MAPKRKRRLWPLLVIGAVLLLGGAGLAVYLANRPEPAVTDKTGALITACQAEVRKHLRAPATAQFSGEKPVDLGDRFTYIDGNVDAQNGFGALIRNAYRCKAEPAGDGWTVIRVDVSG